MVKIDKVSLDTVVSGGVEISGKNNALDYTLAFNSHETYHVKGDASNMKSVLKKMSMELKKYGLQDDKGIFVYTVLSEAINNACKHGYKKARDKIVDINCYINNEQITVVIESDGIIDLDEVKMKIARNRNPSPQDLMLENGRGFFLMSEYADRTYIKNDTTRVQQILVKKLKK